MPRVSRPAAPASARKQGVSAVHRDRQARLLDDRLAHQIGERHLGGRNEPAAVGACGTDHRRTWAAGRCRTWSPSRTSSGRIDLAIAVLAGLQIEHELAKRPFQAGELSLQDDETCARQLGRGLEVHQAQRLAELEMLLRREGERTAARHGGGLRDCGSASGPSGTSSRGRLGMTLSASVTAAVARRSLLLDRLDPALQRADLSLQLLGLRPIARAHGCGDLLRGGIAAGLRFLHRLDQLATMIVEGDQRRRLAVEAHGVSDPGRRPPDCRDSSGYRRSLHRDRFGQVARLVDVGADEHRGVIGEELHRHGIEQRADEGIGALGTLIRSNISLRLLARARDRR